MMTIPIHIINLPHRSDRKDLLLEELRKHKITNFQFVETVYGGHLNLDDMLENGILSFKNRKLTKGECGCYLSHLNAFRAVLESDQELHLVLEDDVFFVPGFVKKLTSLITKVEKIDWDILYLGINCHDPICREGTYIDDVIFYPKNPAWGTHAYLIKKETVQTIMPLMFPIDYPVDVRMWLLDIKRLNLTKTLVKVRNFDSDTQNIR